MLICAAFFLYTTEGEAMTNKRVITRNVDSPYLPELDAAVYLGMKTGRTLQNLRWKGGGPSYLKQGRRVIYRREDLDAWLHDRAVLKKRTGDTGVPLTDGTGT